MTGSSTAARDRDLPCHQWHATRWPLVCPQANRHYRESPQPNVNRLAWRGHIRSVLVSKIIQQLGAGS